MFIGGYRCYTLFSGFLRRFLSGRAFSLRHTGGTRVYPYRFYATTPVASFHRINQVGCVLTSLTAMQDWSCTSSHATPSEIERREFCNGIKDTVTKTDVDDHSCICSSLRELNSPGLRRSALDGAATGTLWLYILSPCGPSEYRKFFHFLFLSPMSVLALLILCTVQPQYLQTQSLFRLIPLSMFSSDTLPAYSQRVFSFSLIESREIESADSDSGGAFLNYRGSTDIGLYLFHKRTSFLVFISLNYCCRCRAEKKPSLPREGFGCHI